MTQRHFLEPHSNLAFSATLAELPRPCLNTVLGWNQAALQYKVERRGGQIVVVDRSYPSSKTCSGYGYVFAMLALHQRRWTCPGCGVSHDRDVNAAMNLKNIAASSAVTACGGDGTGLARKCEAKPAPEKQESNSKVNYD